MTPSADVRLRRAALAAAATTLALAAVLQLPVVGRASVAGPTAPRDVATAAVMGGGMGVAATASRPRRQTDLYRGLATWVDIHDARPWDRPEATVRAISAEGVRTVFIQTANYASGRPIHRPVAINKFIDAAHKHDISVVAWYLPSFARPDVDLRRSLSAIRYRTRTDQRFDGFALDIEAPIVTSVSTRITRMLQLSREIRRSIRPSYSLGAITPSPRGMKRVPAYWGRLRDFPFTELARIYDVIAPMGYYTYRTRGGRAAHDYTEFNIEAIRNLSGRPRVSIHPVGGLAAQTSRDEARAYVRALREQEVLGGSLYDLVSTTSQQWEELRRVPGR